MRRITIVSVALLCITTLKIMADSPTVFKLRIIETSDVHGAFFPYDFIERRPMRGTMARVSTYLQQQRQIFGDDLLLIDNGDILQGQPTCYYANYVKPELKNVAAEVVNYLHYDAEVFGNHDIETGHPVYDKWVREVNCPMLGANIIDTTTQRPYTHPYAILERHGVKIAVLGMLTPAIPNWLHQSLWAGLRFDEMTKSARHWVKILKEEEHADIIVGLFHSGWDGGISTMHYDEDATKKVVENVPGFDVVFFGHDHHEHHSQTNGVLCLDPSCNAQKVAAATLTIGIDQKGKRATLLKKEGELVDVRDMAIDEAFVAHFQSSIDSVRAYVDQQIGTCPETLLTSDCFFGPAAFTDYIHDLQLSHTGADISFNAPLTYDSRIDKGPVYMSDMFKLYRYENQIYVLRMTGEEIRKHLEMSYDQWVTTMSSPSDHIMLLTAHGFSNPERPGFKFLTFNFDSAAGIDYEVDVTKPDGEKVKILRMSDGRPFDESAWYRVAMNSYRGNGGGELLMRGAGIPLDEIPSRIEYMSPRDQRYYLTELIRRDGVIRAKAHNNWRFVPEEWTKPAIERDRKLIFGQ